MKRMVVRIVLRSGVALLGLLMMQSLRAQAPGPTDSAETMKQMDPDATPGFLVVTVKPSDPDSAGGWAFPVDGNRVSCLNATLQNILAVAYGIHPKQIVDGPEWLGKEKYDVHGVPDVPGVPNLRQTQDMYRKLLADRFQLKFHRDVRNLPIYALTVAKGGPRLKTADPAGHLNTGNSGSGGQRTLKFTSTSPQCGNSLV